jgi:hypothetical protein
MTGLSTDTFRTVRSGDAVSDGSAAHVDDHLYALGSEAGEWTRQATMAIRANVPIEVLSDTTRPFPSFSGIYDTH